MTKQTIKKIAGRGVVFALALTVSAAQERAGSTQQGGGGGGRGQVAPLFAPSIPLFFREEWKQQPNGEQHPVTPDAVSNPSLELKLYGASAKDILVSGNLTTDPRHLVWLFNGLSTTPIAATLRHKESYVDLSGAAKIRWAVRTSGFHVVRPVVKLANGTWLVGDHADMSPNYFDEIEFAPSTIRWLPLDIDRVVTKNQTDGKWIDNPDLTKVDEVGYADLMPASGHGFGGFASLGPISVYGKPVKR